MGAGQDARIDFAELAADIAIEAEQAQALTEQIDDLDERSANLYAETDPDEIIASASGVGPRHRRSARRAHRRPAPVPLPGHDSRLLRAGTQGESIRPESAPARADQRR